jgi:hypothetical protein
MDHKQHALDALELLEQRDRILAHVLLYIGDGIHKLSEAGPESERQPIQVKYARANDMGQLGLQRYDSPAEAAAVPQSPLRQATKVVAVEHDLESGETVVRDLNDEEKKQCQ